MAKVKEETKSITNIDSNGYLALKEFDFNTVVSEEMDGLNTVFERIKLPSGGTTLNFIMFARPSLNIYLKSPRFFPLKN